MQGKPFIRRAWVELLQPMLLVAAVILPFRSAIADWNHVPTGSMKPTIVEGDRIFVNKLAYDLRIPFTHARLARWSDPQRGDVVVLFAPDNGIRLVKRVVAVPGDVLAMNDGRLWLNGVPLQYESPAIASTDNAEVLASEWLDSRKHTVMFHPHISAPRGFAPQRVPAGHYFVMGDNRDESRDSRYFGFVARDLIVGRATTIVASFDPQHTLRLRSERFLIPIP